MFVTSNGFALSIGGAGGVDSNADISPYIPIDSFLINLIKEVEPSFLSSLAFLPYIPTALLLFIMIELLLIPLLAPLFWSFFPISLTYIPIPLFVLSETIVPLFSAVEPLPAVVVPLTAPKATCVFVVNFFPVSTITEDLFVASNAIVDASAFPWVIV